MSTQETYTLEEMDLIVKEHIKAEGEILRKNLGEKRKQNDFEYV